MKETAYIVFNASGGRRLTKNPPYLNAYEIAIKLNINISNKFFNRFIPETDLIIPDEFVIEPKIITKIVEMDKGELTEIQKTVEVELEKFVEETDSTL